MFTAATQAEVERRREAVDGRTAGVHRTVQADQPCVKGALELRRQQQVGAGH